MTQLPEGFHFILAAIVLELAFLTGAFGVYVYGRIALKRKWEEIRALNGNRGKYQDSDFKMQKRIIAEKSGRIIDVYRFSKFCMLMSASKFIVFIFYILISCPNIHQFIKATLLP